MTFSEEYLTLYNRGKLVELLELSKSRTDIEANYWEIYSLLFTGKTLIGRQKLVDYEQLFMIDDLWKARYFFLQAFDHWGNGSEEAHTFLQQSFELANRLDSKVDLIHYYIYLSLISHGQGDKNWKNYLEQGYSLATDLNFFEGLYWYHSSLAGYALHLHNFDEALKHIKLNEDLCTNLGNEFFLAFIKSHYGRYFFTKRDYDQALAYYESGLSLAKKTENNFQVANILASISEIHHLRGQLDTELQILQDLYDLELRLSHKGRIAYALVSMADIYMEKGDLVKALSNYESAIKIDETENVILRSSYSFIMIGNIYKLQGKNSLALDYFKKGLDRRLQTNVPVNLITPYVNLISFLSNVDRTKGKEYLDQFETLAKSEKNEFFTRNYNFCNGLYLKNSPRLKDKIQAQLLLESLIRDAREKNESTFKFLPHLIELLLLEYITSKENIVLEEIHQYLREYTNVAESEHRYPAMVKGLLIRAQLSQIEGNYSEAQKLLDEASKITRQINITLLNNELNQIRDNLEAELSRMEEVINKNKDLATKMKESKILSYVQEAQQYIQKD